MVAGNVSRDRVKDFFDFIGDRYVSRFSGFGVLGLKHDHPVLEVNPVPGKTPCSLGFIGFVDRDNLTSGIRLGGNNAFVGFECHLPQVPAPIGLNWTGQWGLFNLAYIALDPVLELLSFQVPCLIRSFYYTSWAVVFYALTMIEEAQRCP